MDLDPERGAATCREDPIGDRSTKVAYLDQNWTAADSLWFYNITQGSDLLPYDFFLALEQADSQELFRSDANINLYRYLPQKTDAEQPGRAAGRHGRRCLQGQEVHGIHVRGVPLLPGELQRRGNSDRWRSRGRRHGPFHERSASGMAATVNDPAKRDRFVAAVLQKGTTGMRARSCAT